MQRLSASVRRHPAVQPSGEPGEKSLVISVREPECGGDERDSRKYVDEPMDAEVNHAEGDETGEAYEKPEIGGVAPPVFPPAPLLTRLCAPHPGRRACPVYYDGHRKGHGDMQRREAVVERVMGVEEVREPRAQGIEQRPHARYA